MADYGCYGTEDVCSTCDHAKKVDGVVSECSRKATHDEIDGTCWAYNGPDEGCYQTTGLRFWS